MMNVENARDCARSAYGVRNGSCTQNDAHGAQDAQNDATSVHNVQSAQNLRNDVRSAKIAHSTQNLCKNKQSSQISTRCLSKSRKFNSRFFDSSSGFSLGSSCGARTKCATKGASKFHSLAKIVLAFVLVLGLLPATGCKPTDVLTEVAYTDDSELLTENTMWQFLSQADPNPDFSSNTSQQSPRIDEQKQQDPTFDQDNPNMPENQTDQTEHEDKTDKQFNASKGDDESPDKQGNNEKSKNAGGLLSNLIHPSVTIGDGGASGSGGSKKYDELTGENKNKDDSSKGDTGGSDDSSSNRRPGEGNNQGGDDGRGPGGEGKIYGGNGTYTELPHSGKLAACGQYALIVQMLGGEGTLSAADDVWLNRVRADGSPLFAGEGMENVVSAWEGTSANLDAIKNSGAEVVLLERNSTYLTNDQITELTESGISVVHMPKLGAVDTSQTTIEQAVNAVGEIMRVATNGNSSSMAQQYVSMVSNTTRAVEQKNGGTSGKLQGDTRSNLISKDGLDSSLPTSKNAEYNTAYIDNWVYFGITSYEGEQAWNGAHDFYLNGKTVDASDGAGVSACNSEGKAGETCSILDYFLQSAGVGDQSNEFTSLKDLPTTLFLATPLGHTNLQASMSTAGWSLGANTGLWLYYYDQYSGGTDNSSNYIYPGMNAYPGLIVREEVYADRIVASSKKAYGFYNSGKAYRVYVMPSGVSGSWADGGVESFLVTPWAYTWFQCYNNEDDRNSCVSYFNDFYNTFYRCSFYDAYDAGLVSGYGEVKQAGEQWLQR